MKLTYQYRCYPDTKQKLTINSWLRTCRYWYNRMIGERFDWYEQNRCSINACPLICHLAEPKERPTRYSQQGQLPTLKEDLILVKHSGELLDFTEVYSTVLQDVCKRVDMAFDRFLAGDSNGKHSGKPRFKSANRYRTFTCATAKPDWIKSTSQKWLFLKLPKIGVLKVRYHRPIPNGMQLKQVLVTSKSDGYYVSLFLEDKTIPDFRPDIIPTWENSIGLDAVLQDDIYLATSEGEKLTSLKPLRKNQAELTKVSQKKNLRKKGSKSRRKLAKREGKIHQRIARERKDFHYKTAHKLVRTDRKVIFHEDLNLAGLSKRNKAKQDENGTFLPNGQRAKSGLNKSWNDAAFGQFFIILGHIAAKSGAIVKTVKPQYTSMLLSYRDEIVFTDCSIREYWDVKENLFVDRDINASLNIKRLGLGLFPSIKRSRGNLVVSKYTTNSTSNEILLVLRGNGSPHCI